MTSAPDRTARAGAPPRLAGALAPVLTPFGPDLAPDAARFARLCRALLDAGLAGLAVFGTTSEANSLSVEEREALLAGLLEAGVPAGRLVPGTGCCAIPDTVRLTRAAVRAGCAGVLALPPFYYKAISEEGLFRAYAEVIERVGDDRLRVYLYHIPPVSQVGIPLAVIERLLARYPGAVAGMKDSSGDLDNTRAAIERFASAGFDVFTGSERFLLATLRAGGAGCITATANVNASAIARLAREWRQAGADARQQELNAVRSVFERHPVVPALKHVVAHFSGDPGWRTVRPPLVPLADDRAAALLADLRAIGFEMAPVRG
jgi:4-hydroxy-tetrahydrodipicolinate synthase